MILLLTIIFIVSATEELPLTTRWAWCSILAFVFVLLRTPPISVMLILLAVVAASATLDNRWRLQLLVRFVNAYYQKPQPNCLVPALHLLANDFAGTEHSVYPTSCHL